eukprot:TRINITY_DN6585_c1_g2_i1.p1 TRINITY_DN6585_c1_g2~~TRINITY_DN6585_c1_g2_i1.p1  ORF type:complete len:320 (-),score=93.05 TRINITY_DN6585_c1_g2_i1:33-992(-)
MNRTGGVFGLSSQEFSGYNTMQNGFESSQAGGGGGFMSSQSGGGDGKAARNGRSLLPVTIKQLLLAESSADSKFKIDDHEISQCKIIGQVMQINASNTTMQYVIDDGTGSITVKMFIGNDDDVLDRKHGQIMEYSYARVFGRLAEFQGKRSISGFAVTKVEDFNEITRHRLEAVYAHLVNTRGSMSNPSAPLGSQMMSQQQHQSMGMGMGLGMASSRSSSMSSFGSQPAPGRTSSASGTATPALMGPNPMGLELTPVQDMVFNVFYSNKHNSQRGITRQDVINALPQLNAAQVNAAIDFLTNEGHVFSTVDDDHFSLCM